MLLYVLPTLAGVLLAALAALAMRPALRAWSRRDGASGADPHLAAMALRRVALAETASETDHVAAQAAEALAQAARRLPVPGIAGTVRTWLASADLAQPRLLLAHQGTEEAYDHVRVLADLTEHPERATISARIQQALDTAEHR